MDVCVWGLMFKLDMKKKEVTRLNSREERERENEKKEKRKEEEEHTYTYEGVNQCM